MAQNYIDMQGNLPHQAQPSSLIWEGGWDHTDSGVQSGATTRGVPSVRSANVRRNLDDYDLQSGAFGLGDAGYSQLEQQLMQTRDERIREAMFGESLDPSRLGTLQATSLGGELTNVQQLAEPSQQVTDSVANLITYQDDADIAQQAIPELMRLLQDADSVVVNRSAMMVHQLSKKEASRHAIMNSQPMMATIIQVLSVTNDPDTQRSLAGTLHNVSHHRQGLVGVFYSGGIPVLVRLLRSSLEPLLFYAITTLHNLLLHQDGAKKAVREAGGIPEMVRLLSHPNVKFLAITTDCLQTLAYANQESKLAMLSNGAPREIVRIMSSCNYEKLLWTTCRLLKVLSVCPSNKPVLVECGALQALGLHLSPNQSSRLVLNCLWTIRNLSDAATRIEVDQLLATLVNLLFQSLQVLATQPPGHQPTAQSGVAGNQQLDHAQVVSCVCGILSNLTCNNMRNKQVLTHNGGLRLLVRVLIVSAQLGYDRDDILEPAVCAMRHLTSKHTEADQANNIVREENGIPVLVHFLAAPPANGSNGTMSSPATSFKWPVQKALASLVRNLSLSQANCAALRECGAIRNLIELLNVAHQYIRARQTASQSSVGQATAAGATVLDGVRLEEVLEHACGALHILAGDPASRSAIAALNCVPLFVQLLYVPAEPVQRTACGLLCELAVDREQAALIDQVGGEAPLTDLLHSRSEPVQQLAANVLMRLAAFKPPEYQARLRVELQNSIGGRPLGAVSGSQQQLAGTYAAPSNQYATPNQYSTQHSGNPYAGQQNTMMSGMAPSHFGGQQGTMPAGGQVTANHPGAHTYGTSRMNMPTNASASNGMGPGSMAGDDFGWADMGMASDDQMYHGGNDQANNVDYLANQVNMMHPFTAQAYGGTGRTAASGAVTPSGGPRTPAEYFHSDL